MGGREVLGSCLGPHFKGTLRVTVKTFFVEKSGKCRKNRNFILQEMFKPRVSLGLNPLLFVSLIRQLRHLTGCIYLNG